MSDKLKTIPDIIAEMRGGPIPQHRHDRILLRQYADSIETAYKREKAEIEADALAVGGFVEAARHKPGNAAKLREALEAINCVDTRGLKRLLWELVEADIFDGGLINKTIAAVEKARCAISAPPRNCDVGTAEEQSRRFCAFCRPRTEPCDGCACLEGARKGRCEFVWAQMPYEEEGAE